MNCGCVDGFIIFGFLLLRLANETRESSEKSSNKSESEIEPGEVLRKFEMINIWNVNLVL